jgi:hypothetical protein
MSTPRTKSSIALQRLILARTPRQHFVDTGEISLFSLSFLQFFRFDFFDFSTDILSETGYPAT